MTQVNMLFPWIFLGCFGIAHSQSWVIGNGATYRPFSRSVTPGTLAVTDPALRSPSPGTAYKLNIYLIIPGSYTGQILAMYKWGNTDYTVKATSDQIKITGEEGLVSVYLPTPLVFDTSDVPGFYFYDHDVVPVGYDNVVICDSASALQYVELGSALSQGMSPSLTESVDGSGQYICEEYSWELEMIATDLGDCLPIYIDPSIAEQIITSPYYNSGSGYKNDMSICWEIDTYPGKKLYISAVDYDLENTFDEVVLSDGFGNTYCTLTGQGSNEQCTNGVNPTVRIHMTTDGTVNEHRGFKLRITLAPQDHWPFGSLSAGEVAGIFIGCIIFLVSLVSLIVCCCYKKNKTSTRVGADASAYPSQQGVQYTHNRPTEKQQNGTIGYPAQRAYSGQQGPATGQQPYPVHKAPVPSAASQMLYGSQASGVSGVPLPAVYAPHLLPGVREKWARETFINNERSRFKNAGRAVLPSMGQNQTGPLPVQHGPLPPIEHREQLPENFLQQPQANVYPAVTQVTTDGDSISKSVENTFIVTYE